MLLLLLKVGTQSYAIETRSVLQIVPSTLLQFNPSNSLGTTQAGFLQWQIDKKIELIPVIDLSQLLLKQASPRTIGTRIMVVKDETDRIWGLMAPAMVQTWKIEPEVWEMSGSERLLMRDQTLIYGLSIDELLAKVRESYDQSRMRNPSLANDLRISQGSYWISE